MIVFDMDGVLAEVTESYREAIVQTVEHFTGQRIARDSIQDYKNQGGWNNDWALSQKIAADLGVEVPYDTVVDYFNEIFIGEQRRRPDPARAAGFRKPGLLERLRERFGLAIFTGRLQYEAEITLKRFAPALRVRSAALRRACHQVQTRAGWPADDPAHEARTRSSGTSATRSTTRAPPARPECRSSAIAARDHSRRDEILRLFQAGEGRRRARKRQ